MMVFESHTDVAKVQQIWKYIPQVTMSSADAVHAETETILAMHVVLYLGAEMG